MKEYIIRLSLLLKKQFTNKLYICFLVAMPLCILLAQVFTANSDGSDYVPVGYYIAEQDEEFSDVLRDSLKEISGRLKFVEYDDKEEMLSDTSASALECSYIFAGDLFEGLLEDDYKNTILTFNSPSTVIADMVNEMVFSSVFRAFGDSVLYVYVDDNPDIFGELDNDELKNTLHEAYTEQLTYGHTFSLDFKVYDGNIEGNGTSTDNSGINSESATSSSSFGIPVHGIIALFLFLCLLLACSDYCTEFERGTFNMLTPKKQLVLSSCFIHSWLLPAVASSLLTLIIAGCFGTKLNTVGSTVITSALYELFVMFVYYMLLMLLGLILNLIIKKSIFITALIPVLITGSLIFCPVIISLSAILPIARVVEKLFLPYYYLIFF